VKRELPASISRKATTTAFSSICLSPGVARLDVVEDRFVADVVGSDEADAKPAAPMGAAASSRP